MSDAFSAPWLSMDARPVLIPIMSSVVCFPIVAFAVICALRYRAQRVRRKERLARLRGAGVQEECIWKEQRVEKRGSGYSRMSTEKLAE
ncbi:hypothetical protein MTO96_025155 [Rhipicephalus appendiculatus]